MILKRKQNKTFILIIIVATFLIYSLVYSLSNKNFFFVFLSDIREKVMTYDHGFSSTKGLLGISTFKSISIGPDFIIDVIENFPINLYKSASLKFNDFPDRPVIETLEININLKNYKKILDNRKEALKKNVNANYNDAKATIIYNGKKYNAKLRLKGNLRDHFDSVYRMSLRVDLKDEAIFGLKRFNIQKSRTRHHPYDQTFGKLIKDLGILAPYQSYARIIVNGDDWGIMNIEEHISKELLEKQKHRDSIVVKFKNKFEWPYYYIDTDHQYPHYKLSDSNLNLMIYQKKKYLQDPIYRLWFSYIANERLKKNNFEIYDLDSFSKAYSLALIWGYWHPLFERNSRYYFDPYLLKLKPIIYDQLKILNLDSRKSKDILPPPPYQFLINHLPFKEKVNKNFPLVKKTSYSAQKYINYFQSFFPADNKIEVTPIIKKNINTIEKFSGDYLFPKVMQHVDIIPKLPTEKQAKYFTDHIHARHFTNGQIDIYNLLPDNVKIKNIYYKNKLFLQNINLDGYNNGKNIPLKLKTKIFGIADKQIIIETEYKGNKRDYTIDVSLIPGPYFNPLTDIKFNEHPFLKEKNKNEWIIKKGVWNISKPIFLNGKVTVEAGTELNFSEDSYLIIEGQIIALGETKEQILLKSNSSWKGIYVIGDGEKESLLKNVEIRNTTYLHDGILQLTGGVNFYNSQIQIKDTKIVGSNAEDALNIINSNFKLENVEIGNTFSDGLNSDYSNGIITNSKFYNCGGDAIDLSGGYVSVYRTNFEKIYDKAVSAGETNSIDLQNIFIKNVGIGAASRDSSNVSKGI